MQPYDHVPLNRATLLGRSGVRWRLVKKDRTSLPLKLEEASFSRAEIDAWYELLKNRRTR